MWTQRWAKVLMLVMVVCVICTHLTVSAAPVLYRRGMSGENIRQLQNDLIRLELLFVDATGYYGALTEQAVSELQKRYGYVQDGIAGPLTLSLIDRLLDQPDVLQVGDRSEQVKQMQALLQAEGYFQASPTGYYGSITKQAVSDFQRENGLSVTGVFCETTAETLLSIDEHDYGVIVLEEGMSGREVEILQDRLRALGVYVGESTGYFGPYTKGAVIALQSMYGYTEDGVVGPKTYELIDSRTSGRQSDGKDIVFFAESAGQAYRMPWFGEAEHVFGIGTEATVYDILTGRSFRIVRTYGYNHADCETLTAEDTRIMYEIFGGWSWERRAIILKVDDTYIAASMAGMPHAGRDDKPANAYVHNRSGGFGYGANLDAVKGNHMDGVFCIHFFMSRTHSTNSVCERHQEMVDQAWMYAQKHMP